MRVRYKLGGVCKVCVRVRMCKRTVEREHGMFVQHGSGWHARVEWEISVGADDANMSRRILILSYRRHQIKLFILEQLQQLANAGC